LLSSGWWTGPLYSEHLTGDGNELFVAASKLDYEGIRCNARRRFPFPTSW
jgi:hypothetical protein